MKVSQSHDGRGKEDKAVMRLANKQAREMVRVEKKMGRVMHKQGKGRDGVDLHLLEAHYVFKSRQRIQRKAARHGIAAPALTDDDWELEEMYLRQKLTRRAERKGQRVAARVAKYRLSYTDPLDLSHGEPSAGDSATREQEKLARVLRKAATRMEMENAKIQKKVVKRMDRLQSKEHAVLSSYRTDELSTAMEALAF
mmetsp:Transcript_3448/g.9344  ORF Transcript_3448/g.9344 Transcript_3448/m.9344 type:complete len:197 (+) Transcript_3448:62-652(+)